MRDNPPTQRQVLRPCRLGEWWIAARSDNIGPKRMRLTDIWKFRISRASVTELSVLIYGIPGEIHQIDMVDDELWIPHTGYNQVLRVQRKLIQVPRSKPSYFAYCSSSLEFRIPKPSHLNSIFYDEPTNSIYLVAHNLTAHTGRPSVMYKWGRDSGQLDKINISARSAHNVYVDGRRVYYLDSENGSLYRDSNRLFRTEKLLRGLSVTNQHFFVGGSDISFDRGERYSSNATILKVTRAGQLVGRLDVPGIGDVYEIRQAIGADLAMAMPRSKS